MVTVETCGIDQAALATTEAAIPWRVARSLLTLRAQIDRIWPGRSKASDGTIGDASHASRSSDHNPWITDPPGNNVVSAMDITHDPDGPNADSLAEALRVSRDPRIKYVIRNRRLFSSYAVGSVPAWTWRTYTGSNPHTTHVHISVNSAKSLYDSTQPWTIGEDDTAVIEGIQRALNAAGWKGQNGKPLTVDGIWGDNTEYALTQALKPVPGPRGKKGAKGDPGEVDWSNRPANIPTKGWVRKNFVGEGEPVVLTPAESAP